MVLRALGFGIAGMVGVPIAAAFIALAVGHLAGACGPGSSGGCEMGAAALGLYAILPGFLIGAADSAVRDVLRRRSSRS